MGTAIDQTDARTTGKAAGVVQGRLLVERQKSLRQARRGRDGLRGGLNRDPVLDDRNEFRPGNRVCLR